MILVIFMSCLNYDSCDFYDLSATNAINDPAFFAGRNDFA